MFDPVDTQPPVRPPRRWPWVLLGLLLLGLAAPQLYRLTVARQVRSEMAALRAAGFPVTVRELETWQAPVADQDNAALKIMEAADYLALGPETFGQAQWPALGEELSPAQRDAFKEILTNNTPALEAAHAVAALKQSRFPIDYSRGPNALLPHLAKIRSLAQLLKAEALIASDEGQPDRATRAVLDSLALARSLDHEPLLISQLVRIACVAITCSSLERLLSEHPLADAQLAALSDAFRNAREASTKAFQGGYLGEICIATYVSQNPVQFYEATSEGATIPAWTRAAVPLYAWTGLRDRDLLFYLQRMHEILDAAIMPFPARVSKAREIGERTTRDVQARTLLILSRMLLPALERSSEKSADLEARLRCAETALALERYRLQHGGALPENLTGLTNGPPALNLLDPMDGAPLRYRKLSPGYMVYSVGIDTRDDGGVERSRNGGSGVRKLHSSGGAEAPADAGGPPPSSRSSGQGADILFQVGR